MKIRLAVWLFVATLASGQASKPIIDNERVTVWDTTWTKDQPGFSVPAEYDALTVWLTGGNIRITLPEGKSREVKRTTGDADFSPRGPRSRETWDGAGAPPRTIEIALKDHAVLKIPNTSGFPPAFPRSGAKKLIDNDRILVWDYRWEPGIATPMHFHDKDALVTYLDNGDLTSTTPDGKSVVNPYTFGAVRFNLGNRSHREVLTRGSQRAIIMEFK